MNTQILKETDLKDEQGRVIYQFGRFPTNADGSDVDTPINWIMLCDKRSEDGHGKVLLLSEKILYCYWYHGNYAQACEQHRLLLIQRNKQHDDLCSDENYGTPYKILLNKITINPDNFWKSSDLYCWLNGDNFLYRKQGGSQAFSPSEKEVIQDNDFGKVFCLSLDEVKKYLKKAYSRSSKSTDFAKVAHTIHTKEFALKILNSTHADSLYLGKSDYWLRSTGYFYGELRNGHVAVVRDVGIVYTKGFFVDVKYTGVRPAIWINL